MEQTRADKVTCSSSTTSCPEAGRSATQVQLLERQETRGRFPVSLDARRWMFSDVGYNEHT